MRVLITRVGSAVNLAGGAELSALLHNKLINELGHDALLYANFKTQNPRVKLLRIPANKIYRWIWSWVFFPLLAVFKRVDILNPHSREDQITLTLTKWLHRTPVVWKDPGDLIHQIQINRKNNLGRFNQNLLIAAIKRADAIYMLNEENRSTVIMRLRQLKKEVDIKKFKVIQSDILFEEYNLNASSPIQKSSLVIGTVGQLEEHKGVQYVIKAAPELLIKRSKLEFWVIGEGPYRAELEKLAKDLPIRFWGYQDDISPFLKAFDIVVQPSEFEGWGRSVKEAMYFGKPVVGSNTGGIAVQIEDGKTGLLFEPGNVKQLTEKLELLINDKALRERLGKAARKKALADGDYVTLVKTKILPFFEEVLARK